MDTSTGVGGLQGSLGDATSCVLINVDGVGSRTLSALVRTMVVPTMAMGRAQLSSELTRLLASGSSS